MFSLFSRLLPAAFLALCLLPESSCATPVFLENVSESGGWYDCNKKTKWDWGSQPGIYDPSVLVPVRPPEYSSLPVDSQLCWAAAASNVLQWWQDTRSDLKPTTPNGKSATCDAMPEVSQLAIYQTISKNWTNAGGSVEQAYNWWINGGMLSTTAYPTGSTTSAPGGYWQELGLTVPPSITGGAVDNPLFTEYAFWEKDTKDGVYQMLMESINNNWGTTLTIGEDGRGHAITMWGYDMNADGSLIVYLTDSDDYKLGMFRQKVIVNNYEDENGFLHCDIYLTSLEGEENVYGYTYDEAQLTGTKLGEMQSFTAPLGDLRVPEPSAGIFSLCGVFLFLPRRRRIPR